MLYLSMLEQFCYAPYNTILREVLYLKGTQFLHLITAYNYAAVNKLNMLLTLEQGAVFHVVQKKYDSRPQCGYHTTGQKIGLNFIAAMN